MGNVIFVLVGGTLVVLAWLLIPTWMIKRNIRAVVRIFRQNNAVGIHNARTIKELRLEPRSVLQRLYTGQDWRNKAMNLLIQTDVVLMTEDNKLYITEESLASATWIKLKQ